MMGVLDENPPLRIQDILIRLSFDNVGKGRSLVRTMKIVGTLSYIPSNPSLLKDISYSYKSKNFSYLIWSLLSINTLSTILKPLLS